LRALADLIVRVLSAGNLQNIQSGKRHKGISNKIEKYPSQEIGDWVENNLCSLISYYYFCMNSN